ncbi:MAG: flavodoxin family protein [Chloroflexi bacterium]|nr:flavodoxin family protein [Chloroflexota bacterium]
MNALIIYDSDYGNTEQIALAVGAILGVRVQRAGDADAADLKGLDLLVIGSPTHGGFPTEGIHELLSASPLLRGTRVAAFDTRTSVTMFGYAAPKIGRRLAKKGAKLVVPPEGFLVEGIEGPLMNGELQRAATWAKALAVNVEVLNG